MAGEKTPLISVRLDVWLDVACLFPTRSQAKAACEGGKVDVNGMRAKPHREVRPGDHISLAGREGTRRELTVRGLAAHSIPRAQARNLYDDVTPAPAPEVIEARRLDRMLTPKGGSGRPDKKDRRERIRLKRG
ncbi:MAG TPA: S4 domain-containing protein [Thermoanaerobaculia bacterium]|jgi:ribosome-associated heat shock protein Hsp15